MNKRGLAALALFSLLITQPALADFHAISSSLERGFGFRRTWIPFLGVARLAIRTVHPTGVHDFQLAVYEHTPKTDPMAIEKMMASRVARGYTRLVRVRSARSGEWTFIYARPTKDEKVMELLVLAHDNSETVLVRVSADMEKVMRQLGDPVKMRMIAER